MTLRELVEGREYVDNHSYRVKVTGFCRHVETRESFVRFRAVSSISSGPHDMVANEAWWFKKGFKEAPPESPEVKKAREGE